MLYVLRIMEGKKIITQINPTSHYAFLGTGRKHVSGKLSPNYEYINDKTIAMANLE